MKKRQIEEEVQRTLASLDQLERAQANPYLATRVLARWESAQEEAAQTRGAWRWQWALVVVLLIVNCWAILPKWVNFNAREDYLNSVADDYNYSTVVNETTDYSPIN
ncbi:MAG: hypothetical protein ACK4TA_15275 [Saprospiraceae bacterium]